LIYLEFHTVPPHGVMQKRCQREGVLRAQMERLVGEKRMGV
jgi:hypothetical protein